MVSPLSQAQLSMFLASQGLDDKSGNYQQALLFTMPVLYRMGFCWNHTSSAYVDMIFEMLKTLNYFE